MKNKKAPKLPKELSLRTCILLYYCPAEAIKFNAEPATNQPI